MNKTNYKWVVAFITVTILITIGVQVYWNRKEMELNKQNLINRVQLSLDNSVETYFANLTKSGIITYSSGNKKSKTEHSDTVIVKTNSRWEFRKKMDSTLQIIAKKESKKPLLINNHNYPSAIFTADRSIPKNIDSLISKVFISISRDTLDLKKLDSYLGEELKRNNISIAYALKHDYKQRINLDSFADKSIGLNLKHFPKERLTAVSRSTFLPHRSSLEMYFIPDKNLLLRNSLLSIFLSLLLSLSIIGSLIFLLKTIYKQKQLSEVKNDLISNITHEFKTPIATIFTALEALKNFNALDDKVKSEKYISIAHGQADKLSFMVEKILETASLNHDSLILKKERVDVSKTIAHAIDKYKLLCQGKSIIFNPPKNPIYLNLDTFHFENALGNIIDNAIKYGGNTIQLELNQGKNATFITIKDNGNGISKSQKDKVFDQFYRIPTGNTHNVKGFGIGLYYTKKIIEKHNGEIEIIYDQENNTIFQLKLPNG